MVKGINDARPVAAIGNFDGVHRGHQYLLGETKKLAAKAGGETGVIVFDPHPRRFFRPDDPPFLLTTEGDRDWLLLGHGADFIRPLTFDAEMAALTPEAFVKDVLRDHLNLGGVVTGDEFQFGKNRSGDVNLLKKLCEQEGIAAHRVAPLAQKGHEEKIGSSAVRKALRDGDIKKAERLLGRRWPVTGEVEEGQKLGRTIGFPTANISLGELVEPKYGVYAVTVLMSNDDEYHAVANFGRKPTVGSDAPLLEVHLFDFDGDLYGRSIEVSFVDFIRPEQKFDGIEALQKQIAADAETAKKILAD